MNKTVKISIETYNQIKEITKITGLTHKEIIKKAIDKYNRELLLERTDQAFKKLKQNKKAWREYLDL
ncbi:hypothetical protein A3F66_01020 [candidate division TM6 bacterium RIFCSPHIGHO2_12_FULL_32_22]|nr:MAG: hypothetical protein A3F66_01020 [candidate division TM6 bacterium RIFCSPHIGHO2_12_FULL_32_22]